MKNRSKFIQQQRMDIHKYNKSVGGTNRKIRRFNSIVENYQIDSERDNKEFVKDLVEKLNLNINLDEVDSNSRFFLFTLLIENIKKSIKTFENTENSEVKINQLNGYITDIENVISLDYLVNTECVYKLGEARDKFNEINSLNQDLTIEVNEEEIINYLNMLKPTDNKDFIETLSPYLILTKIYNFAINDNNYNKHYFFLSNLFKTIINVNTEDKFYETFTNNIIKVIQSEGGDNNEVYIS